MGRSILSKPTQRSLPCWNNGMGGKGIISLRHSLSVFCHFFCLEAEKISGKMSGTAKKVTDIAFKAGKKIDWEGMAKLLVSDEARKEFSSLRRSFDEVNSQLQTKFSQVRTFSFSLSGLRYFVLFRFDRVL